MKCRENFYGFTLVEMIVVIAIAAALATFGVVSFRLIPTRQVQSDARAVVSDLCWARARAVTTNSDHCLRFDVNGTTGRVFYDVYQGSCATGASLKRKTLKSSFSRPSSTPFDVNFYTYTSLNPTRGGTAQCNQSLNSRLDIDLYFGTYTSGGWRVYLFEDTGYAAIEKWP